MKTRQVEIVGAGPAGLSAALAARAGGAEVVVREKRADVGARFHGDFQGLENWTSKTDVLADLEAIGIETTFDHTPVFEFVCFDSLEDAHTVRAPAPLFYLVRRGALAGTLDYSLKAQALAAGITIEFGSRSRQAPDGSVVAEGPHRADVIAAGYVFDTDMANGCYAVVANRMAPAGYSYLLVDRGRGTVATCLFEQFHHERQYFDKTIEFFQRTVGLQWHNARRFGGSGNYDRVRYPFIGNRLHAGESAGFQDALFGFGLRYALTSGHLAGTARGSRNQYEHQCRSRLGGMNEASVLNRWIYARLGDRGRRAVLRRVLAGHDSRDVMRRIYAPAIWKSALARWVPRPPLLLTDVARGDCDCTWCRCRRDIHVTSQGRA